MGLKSSANIFLLESFFFFMNITFCLIAMVHKDEQLGVRRGVLSTNEQQSILNRKRLEEFGWAFSTALLVSPISLNVCPHSASCSHAPFFVISCFPDVVVGGGESAGVPSWRHSCTTAPDTSRASGKAFTKTERGTAVRRQPDPA